MTTPLEDELPGEDVVLPTYSVLSRWRRAAADGPAAVRQVVQELTAAQEPFHEVDAERRDDDGSWLVLARFVTVSVDAHTAVAGVVDALAAAGLQPEECWTTA